MRQRQHMPSLPLTPSELLACHQNRPACKITMGVNLRDTLQLLELHLMLFLVQNEPQVVGDDAPGAQAANYGH